LRASWLASRRVREKLEDPERPKTADPEAKTFVTVGRGPVGHVYFANGATAEQKQRLAESLVKTGKVAGVLFSVGQGKALWVHAKGSVSLPEGAATFLPHAETLRAEIGRDLVRLAEHKNAGDVILLGWHPEAAPWSFTVEHGAHAGPGTEETSGFALVPAHTRFPSHEPGCLRPAILREGVLHALGRKRIPASTRKPAVPAAAEPIVRKLRVMTYNVHSCVGLDGRLAPSRVARIIRGFDPDIVAVQEIDVHRARSRGEDQATRLARELEMEAAFCCTVDRAAEKYGHALLTRFPVQIVASGLFGPVEDHREPRGVLLAKIDVAGRDIYVANTHFGLSGAERLAQMQTFLGPEWLGRVPADAPLIVCGDFNMTPASNVYALMLGRLRDAQTIAPAGTRGNSRPRRTFPSPFPVSRIDFVFVSNHFEVEQVRVPRNSQTRVASDHLPVVADLGMKAET
jgi:endonuclease/exonuclease/phosphatase family metal-dependent hydrolase